MRFQNGHPFDGRARQDRWSIAYDLLAEAGIIWG